MRGCSAQRADEVNKQYLDMKSDACEIPNLDLPVPELVTITGIWEVGFKFYIVLLGRRIHSPSKFRWVSWRQPLPKPLLRLIADMLGSFGCSDFLGMPRNMVKATNGFLAHHKGF